MRDTTTTLSPSVKHFKRNCITTMVVRLSSQHSQFLIRHLKCLTEIGEIIYDHRPSYSLYTADKSMHASLTQAFSRKTLFCEGLTYKTTHHSKITWR